MNHLTTKEYDNIKNKSYTLVIFNQAGYRTLTWGGLNLKKASEVMMANQAMGNFSLMFDGEVPTKGLSRAIADYLPQGVQ